MSLQPEISPYNTITACRSGCTQVNQRDYAQDLLLTADDLIELAAEPLSDISQVAPNIWQRIIDYRPEVLLIGTGATQKFPAASLLAPLIHAQIGYEIMNSAAAARTYNVLMHEHRRVMALLLIP